MDDSPTAIPTCTPGPAGTDDRSAALAERREAARQSVVEAQARLRRVQDDLTRAAAEWRGQQSAWEERQRRAVEDLADRAARLDEEQMLRQRESADETHRLQEQAATLAERASLLDARDAALALRAGELAEREHELNRRDAAFAAQVEGQETRAQQLAAREAEVAEWGAEVERQRQALAEARDASSAAERELEEIRANLDRLTRENEALRQRQRSRDDESQQALAAAEAEIKRLSDHGAQAAAESERWQREAAAAASEAAALREQAAAAPQVDPHRISDLEKRLQMAIDELRNERQRGAELQKQVAEARVQSAQSGGAGGALDWEAQKRKLLQSLEEDFDGSTEDRQERLSIEETIRVTSHVVDAKEREIEELRQLLEQQSSNFGSVAVGAAALSELVDKDELLQQERQKLSALQEEWQVKLRQAEVELSLERAKLARERVELEERLREIEQAEASRSKHTEAPPASGKKSGGGRWFTRLGLREGDGS